MTRWVNRPLLIPMPCRSRARIWTRSPRGDVGATVVSGPRGVFTVVGAKGDCSVVAVGVRGQDRSDPSSYFLITFTTTESVPVAPSGSVTVSVNVNETEEVFAVGMEGAVNDVVGVPALVSVTVGDPPVWVHL